MTKAEMERLNIRHNSVELVKELERFTKLARQMDKMLPLILLRCDIVKPWPQEKPKAKRRKK
jgi:hypothetical protein